MQSKFIENFTKTGLRFSLQFIAIFIGLYFLFQVPFVEKANQSLFKSSVGSLISFSLSKIKSNIEVDQPKTPFAFHVHYYSNKELEQKTKEAHKRGQSNVKVTTNSSILDFTHFVQIYLPFLLALVLATPLVLRKKILALFIGVGLFWVSALFIYVLKLLFFISEQKIGVYEFDGMAMDLLGGVHKISKAGFFSILVIFVWFATIIVVDKKGGFFKGRDVVS